MKIHTKYYKVAGISIQVNSDLTIKENTFNEKFKLFETSAPAKNNIIIHHHFDFEEHLKSDPGGENIYLKPPWQINLHNNKLTYKWIRPEEPYSCYRRIVCSNIEHTNIDIHHDMVLKKQYHDGNNEFLSLLPTDQILLGVTFAFLSGCIFHSSGVKIDNKGFLFIGHSGKGKSTIASMVLDNIKSSKILCEDRNIVRKVNDTFFAASAWSHNNIDRLSTSFPPLKAIFFLRQSDQNQITQIKDNFLITRLLVEHLIKPLETKIWWDNVLDTIDHIVKNVPCWHMEFDKSGKIIEKILRL